MIRFSRHSLQRMKERGFPIETIQSIVNCESDVIVYPSDRDPNIDLFFGKAGVQYILVVYNHDNETIVTVRNMRKKEKEIFNEVMSNEE